VSSQGCPAMESCKRERQAWSHIYDTAARHRHHPQIAAVVPELAASRTPFGDKFDSVAVLGELLCVNR
jgi:hypothetical protein